MGIGIDTISESLYILVGLTRLHGLDGEESHYGSQWFVVISVILGILTFGLVRLPATKAVPAYLFLLMQIMGICREYDQLDRVREAPIMILCMVVAGICMYFASRRFDAHMERDTTDLTKEAVVSGEVQKSE